MKRPWMPIYIGDYLADTAHLSTAEHGAYILLIMHYWKHGGLPDDDAQLAAIAKMTAARWQKHRAVIRAFFQDGWKHKRVEHEIGAAALASEKAKASAEARWAKKHGAKAHRDHAIASSKHMLGACLSQSQGATHLPIQEEALVDGSGSSTVVRLPARGGAA